MKRFWSQVDKEGPVCERLGTRCWDWTGRKFVGRDYGDFFTRGRPHIKAHRYSYELACGPIPDGLILRHKCDRGQCVNPDHLITGTHKDNYADRVERNPNPNWSRQLTAAEIAWIREQYADKTKRYTETSLAKQLGVSRQMVRKALGRKTNYHSDKAGDLLAAD